MRKTIFTIAMLCIAINSTAQTSEIKEENGNVGIGTSTPATKLEVKSNEFKQLLLSNHGTEKFYLGSVWNSVGSFMSNNSYYFSSHLYTALDDVSNGIQFRETGDINFFSNTGLTPNTNFLPTSRLSIKSNGNVAIGIQTAKARLHVASNNTGQGDSKINMEKYSVFRLNPHATNSTNMQFAQVNNGHGMGIQVTNSGSTANWDIALNPYGGNIGIGTVAPQSKLEVHHSGLRSVHINPQNQLDVTGNSSITIKEFVPSIEFQDSSNSSSDAVAFVNGNRFYVGKKTGAKITSSSLFNVGLNDGNVGIGTTTPRSRLDIGRNLGADRGLRIGDYIEINERETINNAGVIGFNASIESSDVSKFKPAWAGASNASGMILTTSSGGISDLNFYGRQWGTDATPRSLGEFTHVLHLGTNGKVGIGTTDTFGYRLAVNGNIGAKEVKVEVNSPWPDFVFEREYKLPTLKEVENHIKEKGHLKDIPSEAEVKKNGFYLGEMDSKLLQKIEELTLYTIQQEKELKNQKEEIAQLKKQNKELLKLVKEIELIKQKLK